VTTVIDGYEADPDDVAAIVATEVDDEDRSDPTLLYVRAAKVQVLHTAVAREMTSLKAQACLQLKHSGESYASIAAHLGISKPYVQQLIALAKSES
jgi:hypothetical protein